MSQTAKHLRRLLTKSKRDYSQKVKDSQKDLKIIKENKKEIVTKAKFGPSKLTTIPLHLCEKIAFLAGVIIGEGHLKISKKQIAIELTEKELIKEIQKTFKLLFKRNFNIKEVKKRKKRKQSYSLVADSKALHNLFNQVFEIPIGKKSHIVKIPEIIKDSSKRIKLSFLRGILVTEGGKRRSQYGLSTASKKMWNDLITLFKELNIPLFADRWIYKKYNKEYYGIAFKCKYLPFLMQECRSGQTE
jgi:intein/homing endonuclease